MFENIFSKSEKQKERDKNKPKIKIIADNREKNSLVIAELISQGAEVEFKQLDVADYLIGETAVERKSSQDFIGSMINKRLQRQLQEIKQYKNYFLIIEGNPLDEDFQNKNAIRGMLLSILNSFKVPILYSRDEKETAIYLSLLAKKQDNSEISLRQKIPLTKKQQLQFILEGFPNIGPTTAKLLLKKHKTLKKILNLSQEQLQEDIGKKSESFILLDDNY